MKQFFLKEQKFSLFEEELPVLSGIHPMTYHYDLVYYPHQHHYATLVFQVNGSSEQWVDGEKYVMEKGDFLVIDEGSLHSERGYVKDHCKFVGVSFEKTNFTGLADGKLLPSDASLLIHCQEYYGEIISLLREIDLVCWEQSKFCDEIAKINTMKLIYFLYKKLEYKEARKKPYSDLIEHVKDYIDEHYKEALSNEILAKLFFVSESHLLHSFKSELNSSPRNYQIERRIGETQFRLLHTDRTVKEIAEEVGYENTNYLVKLFKTRVGMSPLEFRMKFNLEKNTTV